jgi:hypothetical protein
MIQYDRRIWKGTGQARGGRQLRMILMSVEAESAFRDFSEAQEGAQ